MTALSDRIVALSKPHRHFPDSVIWHLTPAGIGINGLAAIGTPGEPATVRRCINWFGDEMRAACVEFAVPIECAIATLCAEAVGGCPSKNQAASSTRHEPGYINDSATPGRVSIGVAQTLISTARAVLGDNSLTGQDLLEPATSIRAGVAYMASQTGVTGFDPPMVGAAYNAGSIRWDGGSNRWKLACYPLGTGAHVDRWVSFFNDAMRVVAASPDLAGDAPSFAVAMAAG